MRCIISVECCRCTFSPSKTMSAANAADLQLKLASCLVENSKSLKISVAESSAMELIAIFDFLPMFCHHWFRNIKKMIETPAICI